MKKIIFGFLSLFCVLFMASCVNNGTSWVTVEQITSSDTLYVKKVNNLRNDFILGMDASSVISEEASGVKYYDYEGNECDVFETLAKSGINYIRVRVWNNPKDADGNGYGGGNCDIDTAVEIGKRIKNYGLKMLVDFHYSDFWADPSKQMAPKDWEKYGVYPKQGNDIQGKAEALYNYTLESLQKLKDAGVDVGMVQMGNETNNGLAGETTWFGMGSLMISSSKAIKKVFPDALIAVHFANPEKAENYYNYAKYLDQCGVEYDVFGSSYYPYWHGTLENLSTVLSKIATDYNKKTMVMETSYAYTTEDTDLFGNTIGTSGYDVKAYPFTIAGQANSVREVIDTVCNKMTNGIGVCYWEGTWISVGNDYESNKAKWEKYGSGWATSYAKDYDPNDAGKWYGGCAVDNQAMFDKDGKPLESLKVFSLVKNGNDAPIYIDGVLDATETMMTDDVNYKLPETVSVVKSDNSNSQASVTWEAFDLKAARENGNGKYNIKGKAEGYDVYCILTVMEYNFIENYSFEEKEAKWTRTLNSGTLSDTHKIQVTSENPNTGAYAYHFWTNEAAGVNFKIEQSVTVNTSGTYKAQVSVLGGSLGTSSITETSQNVYLYVSVNGAINKTQITITNYSAGFITYKLENIKVNKGDSVLVGINVEINEANCWGDIDDVMFNFVGE